MISPEPNSNTQLALATSITARVRSRWGCGALVTLGLGFLFIKFVSSAIGHLHEIYVGSGERSAIVTRILQVLGACLIVLWIGSAVLVYEYYQVWLGLKTFVVSTLFFNIVCTLVNWHEERQKKRKHKLSGNLKLDDIISWRNHVREGHGEPVNMLSTDKEG